MAQIAVEYTIQERKLRKIAEGFLKDLRDSNVQLPVGQFELEKTATDDKFKI